MDITISRMKESNKFAEVDKILNISRVSSCKYFRLLVRNFDDSIDDGFHTGWQSVNKLKSNNITLLDFTDADEIVAVQLREKI